jgi:hypothetical protein
MEPMELKTEDLKGERLRVFRVFRRTQCRCKFEKLVQLLHLRSPKFSIGFFLEQRALVIRCMIRCWAISMAISRGSRLGVINLLLPCPCTFLIVETMKKPVADFAILSIHDDLTAIKMSGFYLDCFFFSRIDFHHTRRLGLADEVNKFKTFLAQRRFAFL